MASLLAASIGTAPAGAVVITDATNAFSVGISASGALYDPVAGIGFRRNSDSYDPILPGTPRDSWGLSNGTTTAYSDPAFTGDSGIVFSTSSGTPNAFNLTTLTSLGVLITQNYSFLTPNILGISTTFVNVSNSAQSLTFQRDVDWEVAPTDFNENSFDSGIKPANYVGSSYYGFENPVGSFGSSCSFGCNQTGDLGGGIAVSLGTLSPNSATSLYYFYGINQIDQSIDALLAQANLAGAGYFIATQSSENGLHPKLGLNSAFIAVAGGPLNAVPEPATWAMMIVGFGIVGGSMRRRSAVRMNISFA